MRKRFVILGIMALFMLTCRFNAYAQAAAPGRGGDATQQDSSTSLDKWDSALPADKAVYAGKKSRPAPRRDLSGTWDGITEGGTQPKGSKNFPDDADPKHNVQPPYTSLGKDARMNNKPNEGEKQFPIWLSNDPVASCEPPGFPRTDLFNLKAMMLIQTPNYVAWLNQFTNVYRIIWTDGRELPKDPVTRFYGYSVGHWEDDYNFVVNTVGMDDKTWLDNVGRPHTSDMRVTERFHRVNHDILELTVTIDDPKFYSTSWAAADKLIFHLLPPDFDMGESFCSPSEMEKYKKAVRQPDFNDSK